MVMRFQDMKNKKEILKASRVEKEVIKDGMRIRLTSIFLLIYNFVSKVTECYLQSSLVKYL